MKILILEPYDGGSHAQFLNGLTTHSRHQYIRLSLPARKWKWRMRGSAIYFIQQLQYQSQTDLNEVDLIFTCDMTPAASI